MTQEQKNEIRRYEVKRKDVSDQLEIEVNKLASILEQRDTAISNRDRAIVDKDKAVIYINEAKKEIEIIDAKLADKRKEFNEFSDSRSDARERLNSEISSMENNKSLLASEICNLELKYDRYIKLTAEYDVLINKISSSNSELSTINDLLISSRKELKRSKEEAEKILSDASIIKEKNDKEFAILQEMRSGLDFYAERLRNWYHDHGLKLPSEFEVENITKPI